MRFVVLAVLIGCGDNQPQLTQEELLDPATCATCHPKHYQEWSGSMHAFAADDPVFVGMNKRGQRETAGALGDFCVGCHAPMAVRLGLTTDGLNLAELPQWSKGVTCYFCHSVTDVQGEHNNPLVLATDGVMRGGITNASPSAPHLTAYSPLLDGDSTESSRMCGSCHDVVTPAGVHLERTLAEWKESIFSAPDPTTHVSCGACHMFGSTDVIAEVPNTKVPVRDYGRHEHTFAGIDVAFGEWPEKDAQLAAIQRDLDATLLSRVCVTPLDGGQITVRLDNVGAGHAFPSGASHDRRAWAQVIARNENGDILLQSGVVAPDQDPEDLVDPTLFLMTSIANDADGNPVSDFWRVAELVPQLLSPAVTLDRNDPRFDHATTKVYPIVGLANQVASVELRVFIRPLPVYVLRDLQSEGLSPSVLAELPTHELTTARVEWRPELADNGGCVN